MIKKKKQNKTKQKQKTKKKTRIPCSLENNAFSVLHYVIKVNFGMFRTS